MGVGVIAGGGPSALRVINWLAYQPALIYTELILPLQRRTR